MTHSESEVKGAMDVKVTGAEEFGILARRLKEAGAKDLQRELYKGLNRSVKPLREDVKAALPDVLPNRYAKAVGPSFKVSARRRAAGRNPAIYLLGKAKTSRGSDRDLGSLNRGRLRHPLFGNYKHWYDQRITPGFWTVTLEQGASKVRQELVEAIQTVARKIEAGL